MTKEEILKSNGLQIGFKSTYTWEDILKSMSDFAKQEGIEFCQDVLNNIEVNGVKLSKVKNIDASQLYELYQQSKTKP